MQPERFIFGLLSLCLMADCSTANKRCVTSIGGACPPAWSKWEDKCYKVTKSLTWFEAREECIKMGSVLVVPQSDEETQFLQSMENKFWINCNDLQNEGSWECQEGPIGDKDKNWGPNEPNNRYPLTNEPENCGTVWSSSGKWNDFPCDYKLPAFCKRHLTELLTY